MRIHLNEGGDGSGNFGHSGRPGLVGGSSNDFPTSASVSIRKKFANWARNEYNNNPKFKSMADGIAWYVKGFFDPYISAANFMLNGGTYSDFLAAEAKLRGESPDTFKGKIGFSGLAVVGDLFGNTDTLKVLTTKDCWEQTKNILDAIENSPEVETPIYRGGHEKNDDIRYATGEIDRYGDRIENTFPSKPGKDAYQFEKDAYLDKVKSYYHREKLKNLFTPGKTFDVALLSFSNEPKIAVNFATGRGGRGVQKIDPSRETSYVIRVVGKHKGLNISAFSSWNQQEVLTKGTFRVIKVHNTKENPIDGLPVKYVIDVEQIK